jgi:phage shock protein C
MNDIHTTFRNQGLVRPREGRVLGGVIAGLGRRFGIDPWPARLVFVLVLMVIPGSQLLIYPVLWILMPSEDAPARAYGPPVGPPSLPAHQQPYPPAAPQSHGQPQSYGSPASTPTTPSPPPPTTSQ